MKYYELSPEVAGELGPQSVIHTDKYPPLVEKLEYIFQGWLGDELLESFPCFIVSKRLGELLKDANLTGFHLEDMDIKTSDEFKDLYPNRELPDFVRIVIDGRRYVDDFGLSVDYKLIVSETAMKVIRRIPIEYCDIIELPKPS